MTLRGRVRTGLKTSMTDLYSQTRCPSRVSVRDENLSEYSRGVEGIVWVYITH